MMKKSVASIAALAGAVLVAVLITLALGNGVTGTDDTSDSSDTSNSSDRGDSSRPAGPQAAIYRVEGEVQKPVRLFGQPPAYPEAARKERVQGTVVVLAVIDPQGEVISTEIVEAERSDLASAAETAIKEWKFEPATLEGEPVSVYYNLTVHFRLDGGEKPDKA